MRKTKLVAMFGWKYEPEWMVDDLKKNLEEWVDDFAILDCRKMDDLWIHEGRYRLLLREKARKMGADWVLVTSPDERWEKNAGKIIRPLIDGNKDKKIYEFNLRELYNPMWYRGDGTWAEKKRRRLYPLYDDQVMRFQSIQCPSIPQNEGYEVVPMDVNIYHLKHIEPENVVTRTRVFKALDPKNKFQGCGYEYLDDETDAFMVRIPEGREYYPKYNKKYIFKVDEKKLCELESSCAPSESETEYAPQ